VFQILDLGLYMDPMVKKKEQATRAAFVCTRVLDTPFWAIFNMLPFILYKDLAATPLQVAIIFALKPLTSIFSLYWSAWIHEKREKLLSNIIVGGVLRHIPFFFFPFIDNVWFFIAAFGINMMLSRGTQPAWLEILKINIRGTTREKIFAYASALGYIGDAFLPFALGGLLDGYFQAWRWIFPFTAAISMISIFWQMKIDVAAGDRTIMDSPEQKGLYHLFIKPWKDSFALMCRRRDFAKFQIGFMLGGAGLMVIQPALPIFFIDKLNLSYTEVAVALTAFKGIGFALSTPLWANRINKVSIYRFTSWVTALAILFPLSILMSKQNVAWLYLGYLGYGIMQAGSALSWNMSGPIFSNEDDSSIYTSLNVMTVGIRGCVAPFLGSFLCAQVNPASVLILGALLCALATHRLWVYGREPEGVPIKSL
jgi:MFS family permease